MDPTSRTLMMGASAGGDTYWINTLTAPSIYNIYPLGVAVDSSGNVYVAGYSSYPTIGQNDGILYKLDQNGQIQWQKAAGGSNADYFYGVAVDSSNNIFAGGYTTNPATANQTNYLCKFDTSGNFISNTSLGSQTYGGRIVIDSSSNIYVSSYDYSRTGGSRANGVLTKFNSSFNKLWGNYIDDNSSGVVAQWSCADSSGSLCAMSGYGWYPGISKYGMILSVYNSSGVNQFTYYYGDQTYNSYGMESFTDGNNFYFIGYGANNFYQIARLLKLSSSGIIQWQKAIDANNNTNNCYGYSVTSDIFGNVYALGDYYTTPSNAVGNVFLYKYDSSGTLLWKRSFSLTSGSGINSGKVVTDSKGNIFVCMNGIVGGYSVGYTVKVPPDGSKTGTYGNLIYGTPTTTESSNNYSAVNIGYASGSSALGSNGFSASSLTTPFTSSTISL